MDMATRMLGMQNAIPSRHPKYRTKLCRNFASGDCPFGQKCSFVHPASSADLRPSTSAQHLLNWNPLLVPQLLALVNQQEMLKAMLRRSPPWCQGPKLVDQGPSPTTSLLLSNSESFSSDLAPQTKRTSKRKEYACRHFVRTGGWCPAAGQCKFQHDVAALPSAGARKAEYAPPPFPIDGHGERGRTISGGVLMGVQSPPSPPLVNQSYSEPPLHTEPELMYPYQPPYWPTYTWQPFRPYVATVPVPPTAAAPSVAAQCVSSLPQPQPQAQSEPLNQTQTSLPLGSYEVNGTTYFQTRPPVSAPPPVPCSIPVHALAYNHTVTPGYSYYGPVPPTQRAGYYVTTQRTDTGPQRSAMFDPFASDQMMTSDLPVIPRPEDDHVSPIQQDVPSLPPSGVSSLAANGSELSSTNITYTSAEPTVPQEEFPYQPPKEQRVGHARRISVNVKKHGRVNSASS